MIGWGVAAPHIGEVVDWRSFFFRWFVGQAHSRPRALKYHILYINRRGSGQGCAFGGSHRYISSHGGVIPKKPLIFGTPMGISSINVYGHISAKKIHIMTLDGLKCASRQDSQCAIRKIRGWGHFRGQIYKSFTGKFTAIINMHSVIRQVATYSHILSVVSQDKYFA